MTKGVWVGLAIDLKGIVHFPQETITNYIGKTH